MKLSYFLAFLGLAGAAVAMPAVDDDDSSIHVPDASDIIDGGVYYDGPGIPVVGDLPGVDVDI
ncbi:hypothetical protein PENDEC_c026G02678 [Penicillium decumbens]|uniref:Uncharacterized protein n=1 Tax=Penicillium decumbens TaxID=69771 RepID=A0A1V6NZQ4_PENDC|nr:hypothetical protein PENDEC_c026G02678 [Penicillium decumbens]